MENLLNDLVYILYWIIGIAFMLIVIVGAYKLVKAIIKDFKNKKDNDSD
jgi:putative Mn2+ efflux pump MntP